MRGEDLDCVLQRISSSGLYTGTNSQKYDETFIKASWFDFMSNLYALDGFAKYIYFIKARK